MKEFVSLMLLLFASAFLRSQTAFEVGLQGMQQLNGYKIKTADNSLKADGYSCGIRLGVAAGKNLFQTSLLYTQVHIPVVSSPFDEHGINNNTLPSKKGIGVLLLARHHINPQKKACGYLAGGASAIVFNRNIQYNSAAGPTFPGQAQSSRYDFAAVFSPGIRCKIDDKLLLDIETGVNYYFLEKTYYKHNLSFNIGFTLNYRFSTHEIASSNQ